MYCSFTDANGKIGAVNLVAFGSKTACYTFKPRNTLTISPTIPGGYTDADITIINTRNEFVALGEIVQSNGFHEEYFTFPDVTFPLIFLRNETKTITVHFAPTQNFQFASTNLDLKFSGASDSSCSSAHYALAGSTLDPNDTSTVSLFPSQTTSLPMASQTDKITKKFFFRNNASSATKVVSVTMKDGSHFRIVSTNPTAPATLQASGSMEVDIEFDAGANGFYTDDLIIVTDHALTSQTFRMQAIRTNGTSGVNEIAAANPQFVISPNPAHNEVTIHSQNINVRTIGIYDVLGNLISDVKNASEWKWNIPSLVTDGTYFVRMEGTLPGGKGYVTTQKVLIVK